MRSILLLWAPFLALSCLTLATEITTVRSKRSLTRGSAALPYRPSVWHPPYRDDCCLPPTLCIRNPCISKSSSTTTQTGSFLSCVAACSRPKACSAAMRSSTARPALRLRRHSLPRRGTKQGSGIQCYFAELPSPSSTIDTSQLTLHSTVTGRRQFVASHAACRRPWSLAIRQPHCAPPPGRYHGCNCSQLAVPAAG